MAADEALTGVGELLFSLLIGYLGALEFAFVAQHLYHWTCRHPNTQQGVDAAADAEELPRLRDRLDKELAEAAAREAAAGSNVMQDGVAYSNGFRVESPEDKRKALAAELERQRHIEEETRKQLAEAEAKLAEERQRQQLAAEAAEAAESERKLLEAEKQRAAEQREREENERKAREREEQERQENERKLLEAERQREENERRIQAEEEEKRQREIEESARQRREAEEQREREENERKLREAEEQRLEEERQRELQEAETLRQKELQEEAERQQKLQEEAQAEVERQLLQLDDEDEQARRDAEIVERLLAAERERKLSATESELEEEAIALEQSRRIAASKTDLERKQKSIEENARLFMEAEEEMVMLHQRMLQAAQEEEQSLYAGAVPVVEEPCIKKLVPPRFEEPEQECEEPLVVQRVKTQLGQGSGGEEPYMVKSKTLTFPGVSDEGSSVEPISSQQSSFSTQPSEERSRQQTEEERQEPEGEDNVPDVQYTEDYLRSLDGIKSRPLIREDGSGRRRAFKKRRSSGSSNSSRDSRASRDEELKMFTSLEEEELRHGDKADYNPIKYTTEPTLRVKSHHRRHKRSPAKDAKPPADVTSSLEMLGEESTNPWGEVMPEHYKDTEFWKREKALSIDEEELDLEKRASGEEVLDLPKNKPNASSFEEATDEQNELAANTLRQQHSKEQLDKESTESSKATEPSSSSSDIKSNLIFSGEYTKAMDKDWHSGHFCCWQCDESLTGQRYVIRDDHPYCIKCYENVFANTCEECNKIIGIDSKDLSYKDKHWHEACFLCFKCNLNLVDKQFGAKADKIYCGNCYDAQFASRCDGCGEVFRAGTKKMEYKTRQWHENCFCCCVCKMAIGTKSFIPREQEIYCAGCYEEKFATRCIKCNKVITSGGVTYKNEPWHRECFTCTHCNITLAGQRFTSRDEKPYCAECFGELFAKRCTSCVKPITGIGGTRFISFEERHWHHDCFVCASCKASLVGRGFITDGPDILCPDCAKQKLM
ncbi:trichohyalin isoform X2 [Drosophila sulfurigaster albostrigata]|uniref:trichohyalin isoform X2 n=1 Tax=Drosophila sulfurigaster albostrigata TaxID=89887 RepID=UPI002D218EDA|nr:trichohyalin isoform X2 [Drosophila sulfurigaster albostrigata]